MNDREQQQTALERMVRCRDCKHWKTAHPEYGETYDRNQPPDQGWWDGVCKRLQQGVTITASGGWDGATVDSVETDGNFACIYGETPNDQAQRQPPGLTLSGKETMRIDRQIERAQRGGCSNAPAGSVKWSDPHFQLAAEHFGYVPNSATAEDDREVIALADFLRVKIGEWTVRKDDYDKLATTAKWLRRSCRERLPPGHYAKLEDECRALDAILSPK
jgi:hypothetical protein